MRVLVLGANGMLGNAMMRVLDTDTRERGILEVYGTVRSPDVKNLFKPEVAARLITGVDVEDEDALRLLLEKNKPDVVINCVGLIKQLAAASDPVAAIRINALLPHLLHRMCQQLDARLIHFSTDCVFDGAKGNYREDSYSDAIDLYGKSKFLGEVSGPGAITIRTSIIGHELNSAHSLLDWFLSQQGQCKGYRHAIFSGLPTTVMAGIVRDIVIPNRELSGLYHVSAAPIAKYELLKIIANTYGKSIDIVADDALVIDRSLNGDRFTAATGYRAPPWTELIRTMQQLG